jgi:hypothetical protein
LVSTQKGRSTLAQAPAQIPEALQGRFHTVVTIPERQTRTVYRLPETGKTFIGAQNNDTEVYLHITPNGRVEIKIKRDGEFLADFYVKAED